ncbi:MAG: LysR substrate-binding domain-containing protein [Gammaproteobacteria bacterium]|nr:LysR substrate-binding domain-containing protein [Gammaproteobacteria bacterium]
MSQDIFPRFSALSNDLNFVKHMVLDGQGVALLPSSETKAELLAGTLVRVLPQWQGLPREIYAVWPSGRLLNKKSLCLREHMKHYIGEHCD